MTIGDEKVRRWSLQYVAALEGEFMCADPAGPYVLQSAYAELAAEVEEYVKSAQLLSVERAEFRIRAEKAESQLAELRGAVDAVCDEYEEHGGNVLQAVAKRLRALAAADGGGG